MMNTFAKAALGIATAGVIALPASQAAAATKTENAIIGALLGGVGGAAVSNGRTEGVVLGAVAGAALGAALDKPDRRHHYRSGYRYRDSRNYRPYYGDARYGDRYQQPYYRYSDDYRYDYRR